MSVDRASLDARAEYVTDVPYVRTFTPHLSPTFLRLVAAMNGVAAPPADDFDYCELGCGTGDTLVTLAAAHPEARFLGVDLSADHVASARALATLGGVENVGFLQRDFDDLAAEELPGFDYVALHGVVSWVSPAKRASAIAFASERLRPGGLLYASYNALPGWAVMEPIRRLMLERAAGSPGTTLDRARLALEFVERLADAGGTYFASHPTTRSMISLMRKAGLPYVVHEYFHAHWHPHWFADLAREMAARDLDYVGQLPLHLNVPDLALPAALAALAAPAGDRASYETVKDFALNEFFRSDVYVKGPAARGDAIRRAAFETTRFGTTAVLPAVRREVKLPHRTLSLAGEAHDAILAEIARAPRSALELAEATPALAAIGAAGIGACLRDLALGEEVLPMRALARKGGSGPYVVPLAHNQSVLALERRRADDAPLVVASPASGTGIALTLMDAVCIRMLALQERGASWLRPLVEGGRVRLVVGEARTNDADAVVAAVQRELELRGAAWAAKLEDLGVLGVG